MHHNHAAIDGLLLADYWRRLEANLPRSLCPVEIPASQYASERVERIFLALVVGPSVKLRRQSAPAAGFQAGVWSPLARSYLGH